MVFGVPTFAVSPFRIGVAPYVFMDRFERTEAPLDCPNPLNCDVEDVSTKGRPAEAHHRVTGGGHAWEHGRRTTTRKRL